METYPVNALSKTSVETAAINPAEANKFPQFFQARR